jgi:uncharacterized protein YqgC (DUF456 family)
MEWLWVGVVLLVLIGILGAFLPVIPGIPLVFAGLLMGAWLDDFSRVTTTAMIVIGLLALAGFLVDFVASVFTVKSVRASRQAVIGTLLGGLIGILGGVPGLILGTVIGAVVGEIMARQSLGQATKVGVAAGLGFILAVALKLAIALVMIATFAWAYYY